ncbi:hypothetical protein FQR65_LT20560 [Abscondita terminalis]|nr:hypothetical protein FQR65_LT20560 [Abscondita terminalis]
MRSSATNRLKDARGQRMTALEPGHSRTVPHYGERSTRSGPPRPVHEIGSACAGATRSRLHACDAWAVRCEDKVGILFLRHHRTQADGSGGWRNESPLQRHWPTACRCRCGCSNEPPCPFVTALSVEFFWAVTKHEALTGAAARMACAGAGPDAPDERSWRWLEMNARRVSRGGPLIGLGGSSPRRDRTPRDSNWPARELLQSERCAAAPPRTWRG